MVYKNNVFEGHNISKAIKSFEAALDHEEYEGAVYLAEIYLNYEDYQNRTKGLEYLDEAIKLTDVPFPKLLMISKFFEDQTLLQSFVTCKRVYKLMKSLINMGEIKEWYYLGYQKYTIGEIDQALLLFSFASLGGHKKAALAAGYIWEHNLTQNLT